MLQLRYLDCHTTLESSLWWIVDVVSLPYWRIIHCTDFLSSWKPSHNLIPSLNMSKSYILLMLKDPQNSITHKAYTSSVNPISVEANTTKFPTWVNPISITKFSTIGYFIQNPIFQLFFPHNRDVRTSSTWYVGIQKY